ncbi:MAG TPA: transcription antitermination factor NusB [Thermoanaerobaculia bacterium]|jgi:transcription antitermination protein NusB|nr:transcription antitermination factor NusB [Thermoanaerobaculia bacterium]
MIPGRRSIAREMAVQMLYQSDLGGSPLPQIFHAFDFSEYLGRAGKQQTEEAFLFAQELVKGTLESREAIDEMIRGQADNWRLERMPAVDRNVLRLAIFEMLHETDTPKLVIVDEAIELAKKFGSEQSGRFVNGLLDGLLKQHTFPGSLT